MQARISGGFEPDSSDQMELTSLWHLSRTALAGTSPDRMARLQWVVREFLKSHAGQPNYAHKWVWVWAVDNLGRIFSDPE